MYKFSSKSVAKLHQCHPDLQILFSHVIKYFDCTVVHGHRTPDEQYKLYEKGRTKPGNIVTYKNGTTNPSRHNFIPSTAVDVVPYPIDWKDTDRMRYFGGLVLGVAMMLKAYDAIENDIVWGGDWDSDRILTDQSFIDLPHFQIK